MTLRDWLALHMDNLMAAEFFAVVIAALVGFFRRSTGMAVFMACMVAAVLVLLMYLVGSAWGYEWRILVPTIGVGAGFCGVALFKIAMKFSDRIEERSTETANKLADKAVGRVESLIPGGDK